MATLNFYLKKANGKGTCPVILVYQHRGHKFRYSSKITVSKELWDGSRIKGRSLEVMENNRKLAYLEQVIKDIELEALRKDCVYGIDTIENKFRWKLSEKDGVSDFFVYFDRFIENCRTTKTYATIKGYITLRNTLKTFSKQKKVEISFEAINQEFYDRFVGYLVSDLGQLNNSIGKHIKNLKVFLNYLQHNELVNKNFKMKGFKVFREDIDIIALTDEELWKIYYAKDLPDRLEIVKDLFCFECFTGLRFSDLSKLRNENMKGDFIEIRTQKTRDALFVPLNAFAKEIIEKYRGKYGDRPLPPTITNQKTNDYIKDVAELAGIDDLVIIEKFSGSNRITVSKPKFDLVSTHTGRRTFITLSYERGMQAEMIMKITGIKKWETLKKYLKVSEKAKLIKMNEYWNKNSTKVI